MTNKIEFIKQALKENNHVGIRGLNGLNNSKNYRKNQILKKSYDLWDDKEFAYNRNAKMLQGTSGMLITNDMTDADITDVIDKIKKGYAYNDDDKICLIAGDEINNDDAYDDNESLFMTQDGWDYRGATFLMYL